MGHGGSSCGPAFELSWFESLVDVLGDDDRDGGIADQLAIDDDHRSYLAAAQAEGVEVYFGVTAPVGVITMVTACEAKLV